ncbi:MAG: addiction module toxin RelE [Bacteroidota bacterium]|nr:addiction module toxin RelE [Bacteroidota bacterium]
MKNEIITTPEFDREYKRLKKKYRSLPEDLAALEQELIENPKLGVDLGSNFRKVRLAIKTKNKGKSGGARIITYSIVVSIIDAKIVLVIIYDKGEEQSISDSRIKQIINKFGF